MVSPERTCRLADTRYELGAGRGVRSEGLCCAVLGAEPAVVAVVWSLSGRTTARLGLDISVTAGFPKPSWMLLTERPGSTGVRAVTAPAERSLGIPCEGRMWQKHKSFSAGITVDFWLLMIWVLGGSAES